MFKHSTRGTDQLPKNHYSHFIYDYENSFSEPRFFSVSENGELITQDSINRSINASKRRDFSKTDFETIIATVCDFFDIQPSRLISAESNQKITMIRTIIAYIAHYKAGFMIKKIANQFGRDAVSFSKTFHRNFIKLQQGASLRPTSSATWCYNPDYNFN